MSWFILLSYGLIYTLGQGLINSKQEVIKQCWCHGKTHTRTASDEVLTYGWTCIAIYYVFEFLNYTSIIYQDIHLTTYAVVKAKYVVSAIDLRKLYTWRPVSAFALTLSVCSSLCSLLFSFALSLLCCSSWVVLAPTSACSLPLSS